MKSPGSLKLVQVERRLRGLRKIANDAQVSPGWIQYMRTVLGMQQKQLAKRAKLSPPALALIEKREATGNVRIETLKKLAAAMDCDLVYAFVPRDDIKTILKKQALEKAETLLRTADVHMTLEDQKVRVSWKERVERLAEKLIAKGDVW